MVFLAALVATFGALVTACGSVWLWRGFKPDNPRYMYDDHEMRFGPQKAQGLINLLHDQQKVTALIAIGGAVQLLGTILALIAALQSTSGVELCD
jgi:hypothetical protein